jgi:tRNA pseudouridine55 synthase
LDGLLILDKPEGPTSHDLVARIRRLFRSPRVGHTGTLDPMATGVLPLVLGRATRLARFLSSDRKRYEAVVQLGQATATYDRLGEATGQAAPPGDVARACARGTLTAALDRFRGTITQTPPTYSAKKIAGEAAYKLARRGEAVTPAPVQVHVSRLDLLALDVDAGRVTLDVECSAGFYVRSLAHDLGAVLGCGGHLTALRRTASGEWTLAHAVTLDFCEREPEAAQARLVPMSGLLTWMPGAALADTGVARVRHGQSVRPVDLARAADLADIADIAGSDGYVRLLAPDGALLALARPAADGFLHPALVLV